MVPQPDGEPLLRSACSLTCLFLHICAIATSVVKHQASRTVYHWASLLHIYQDESRLLPINTPNYVYPNLQLRLPRVEQAAIFYSVLN